MTTFIKEILSSLKEQAQERIKNPLIGSFIISWIIINWKIVATLFFSDGKIAETIKTVDLLIPEKDFSNLFSLVVFPLLFAFLYTFLGPIINAFVQKITDESILKSKTIKINRETKILQIKTKHVEAEADNENAKEIKLRKNALELKKFENEVEKNSELFDIRKKSEEIKNLKTNTENVHRLAEEKTEELEKKEEALSKKTDLLLSESQQIKQQNEELELHTKKLDVREERIELELQAAINTEKEKHKELIKKFGMQKDIEINNAKKLLKDIKLGILPHVQPLIGIGQKLTMQAETTTPPRAFSGMAEQILVHANGLQELLVSIKEKTETVKDNNNFKRLIEKFNGEDKDN